MAHHALGKRIVGTVAVASATALTVLGMPAAHAAPPQLGKLSDYLKLPAGVNATITPNRWFVQTDGTPTAKGGNGAANQQSRANVKNQAKSRGLDVKVDAEYGDLWQGMAVTVPDNQVALLAAIPGVTHVYPVLQSALPAPQTGTPSDVSSQVMTGVDIARNQLGLTGKGIKVGVIDSGIDLDHPDLGGNGIPGQAPFPNKRVKYGYDFVGDNYDASGKHGSTTPVPDAVPDDCGGHGSHVAGIIGANGDPAKNGVLGVAPDVTFGAYRVFGCEGSVSDDIIIAALERAGADGMDVVNMSLGWSLATWPGYPEAVAADNLVDRGTIVVDAMGNDGEKGTFTGGAPGVGLKSIAVGSVENTTMTMQTFHFNGAKVGYAVGDNAKVPASGSLDVVSAGPDANVVDGTEPVGGCDAAGPVKVDATGKALLMKRGSCTFTEKAMQAQKAGAKAAIIYNRDNTTLTPAVDSSVTIPVFIITLADGLTMQQAIASGGPAQLTYGGNDTVVAPNPNGGLMSTFSSYGLAADLTLKPDVSAPGGNIWSTYPLEKGGYTNMSGTSMATPHVVGAIAQLLQAKPEYKGHALAVRDLLQNNAQQLLFHLAPQLGLLESVHQQGAGMIDIVASLNAQQHVTPGKLSVGDDVYGKHTQTLTVTNDSAAPVTYTLSNELGVGTSGFTANPDFQANDAVVDMPATVTVPAKSAASFTVTVHSPADSVEGEIYGGYIALTAGDTVLHVPYAGMKGNYGQLPVFTPAPDGTELPALATLNHDPTADAPVDPVYPAKGQKVTYDLKNNLPAVQFHLEYPVSGLQVNVYSVNPAGKNKQFVATLDAEGMLGRDDGSSWYIWDGSYDRQIGNGNGAKTQAKTAKAGDYYFELKAKTAKQSDSQPDVFQTWTSPVFHLNG